MNIFYLHKKSKECAEQHCDKHVVKMILEYAQLLSTAHRVIDGKEYIDASSGRKIKRWSLPDQCRESILYKATHINHPSAVWARQSAENYRWLHSLLVDLCQEYTHRYGKVHKCQQIGLVDKLQTVPTKINREAKFTEPTPAMPDIYKVLGDSIQSYRNYYINEKKTFAKWKKRTVPEWFNNTK